MTESRRVEINLEQFQEGILKLNEAIRGIKLALEALDKASKDLNRAFTHFVEATKEDL